MKEVSALGAAHLAGLQQGLCEPLTPLAQGHVKRYIPGAPSAQLMFDKSSRKSL